MFEIVLRLNRIVQAFDGEGDPESHQEADGKPNQDDLGFLGRAGGLGHSRGGDDGDAPRGLCTINLVLGVLLFQHRQLSGERNTLGCAGGRSKLSLDCVDLCLELELCSREALYCQGRFVVDELRGIGVRNTAASSGSLSVAMTEITFVAPAPRRPRSARTNGGGSSRHRPRGHS